jgi:alpha-L-fucosidase 2
MKNIFFVLAGFALLTGCVNPGSKPDANHLTLWYNQPAKDWNEALPVGNGRLGAMVFGNATHEKIQINEESIWAGCPVNNNNPGSLQHLPEIQKALFESRFKEAWQLANDHMLGTPPRIRSYQPLGDLLIDYGWKSEPTEYRRSLDLKTGVAATEFTVDGKKYRQEVYASVPDNILIINIKALDGGKIDATISMTREKDAVITTDSDGTIHLNGQIIDGEDAGSGPAGDHMKFAGEARITHNGQGIPASAGMTIDGANSVSLRFAAASDYSLTKLDFDRSIDPAAVCAKTLDQAKNQTDKNLMKRHLAEYQPMFNRVDLNLGGSELDSLPTDVRLAKMKEGGEDNALLAMYFQYGRYLLMGSSRGAAQLPANLQGIWNKDMNAAWNSDFHTNINLQMNYWPAEVCNLSETALPLVNFMEQLVKPGTVTAKEMYGTDGWVFHHLVDPFGRTGVADGVWGITPLNGPWMTFTVYEHYLFTGDTAFLRNVAWPMMKGSAEFVLGFLVESPEGYLVTNPSHSPENAFLIPGTKTRESSALTYAATVDIEILNTMFDNCREACRVLGTDAEFAAKLEAAQKRLPPVRINSKGVIQEWIEDYDEVEPGHRHMSHLLGLYPLGQFTPETPELYNAARATIERRLSFGGGQTGWSRAWIICQYARLQDGEKSYQNVLSLLRKCTMKNLFDTHPPFQIDGNFGGTAGIAEMLIQSHGGVIRLLPALPKAWNTGSYKGLCARGGFVFDLKWQDGQVTEAYVSSKAGGTANITYAGKQVAVTLSPGERKNAI